MFDAIDLFFIRTLPVEYLLKAIRSFFDTLPQIISPVDFRVVEERGTREETLNHILDIRDKEKHLFVVVDDVVFLPGWYQSLELHHAEGDILGFSMVFPGRPQIQDFGYDFIMINDSLSYEGFHKHKRIDSVTINDFRDCDAVCGCAMIIKKEVLRVITRFPLDGYNRWGEMIFSQQARERGFKTIVLAAHLEHHGISTKQKQDDNLSSMSWMIEKDLWRQVCERHFRNVQPRKRIRKSIGEDLRNVLSRHRCLVYGCGTIAELILMNLEGCDIDLCSGLSEEVHRTFRGKTVLAMDEIHPQRYERIIISPIGYEEQIITSHFQDLFHRSPEKIVLLERAGTSISEEIVVKSRE